MPRRRFSRRVTRGPKRKYEWEWGGMFAIWPLGFSEVLATWVRVPASQVDNANSSGIPYVIPDDSTLVRTRSLFTFASDNGGAQVIYPWIASAGLIAWDGTSDDPDELGVLPNPYWDQELDWIWRLDSPQTAINLVGSNNGSDVDAYQSRAMRKLSAGTGLLWCFTIADPAEQYTETFLDINLSMNTRMLFKQA